MGTPIVRARPYRTNMGNIRTSSYGHVHIGPKRDPDSKPIWAHVVYIWECPYGLAHIGPLRISSYREGPYRSHAGKLIWANSYRTHMGPRQQAHMGTCVMFTAATVVATCDTRYRQIGLTETEALVARETVSQHTKTLGSAGLSTKQVRAKNAIYPVSSLWAVSTGVAFRLPVSAVL